MSILYGAVWWLIYHVIGLERSLRKPLSVWYIPVVVVALLLPIGLGALLMVVFLNMLSLLAG